MHALLEAPLQELHAAQVSQSPLPKGHSPAKDSLLPKEEHEDSWQPKGIINKVSKTIFMYNPMLAMPASDTTTCRQYREQSPNFAGNSFSLADNTFDYQEDACNASPLNPLAPTFLPNRTAKLADYSAILEESDAEDKESEGEDEDDLQEEEEPGSRFLHLHHLPTPLLSPPPPAQRRQIGRRNLSTRNVAPQSSPLPQQRC